MGNNKKPVITQSRKLQAKADRKNVSELAGAADFSINPNNWGDEVDDWNDGTSDLTLAFHEMVLNGMRLQRKLGRENDKILGQYHKTKLRVYMVTRYQAGREAFFFFIGTVESVLKKLAKLDDAP